MTSSQPNTDADPIKHVVVLMLENRSFDQMLGALQAVYPDLDGVDLAVPPRVNRDDQGVEYSQGPSETLSIDPDPKHDLESVLRQIEAQPDYPPEPVKISLWKRIKEWCRSIIDTLWSYVRPEPRRVEVEREMMKKRYEGAFVLEYAKANPSTTQQQRKEIMGYFPLDFLPALHALARDFTVCDHWFASVPGPTWTNRFFMHSGTSIGRVVMPENAQQFLEMRPYDQLTLYDRLNDKNISWNIYFGDIPQSMVLSRQMRQENVVRYHRMPQFYKHAGEPERDFPSYCFIEPDYFGRNANDDHPPHDSMATQALLARVYNALRENEELWSTTLLVVLYDEHGGFFDHLEPPAAVCPDDRTEEYKFDRLGVRVPALLISPWVDRRVVSTQFDHTSLLKYLSDKWRLQGLGERVKRANSIREALRLNGQPRTDATSRIDVPRTMRMQEEGIEAIEDAEPLNDHQKALLAFSESLLARSEIAASEPIREMKAAGGVNARVEAAKDRVQEFIEQEKRKVGSQEK